MTTGERPVPSALAAQAHARVLRSHALNRQFAQFDWVAGGDVELRGLADAIHRLPPPTGITSLHLSTRAVHQRAVQVRLSAVAFANHTPEANRDHGDDNSDCRRQRGPSTAPENQSADWTDSPG